MQVSGSPEGRYSAFSIIVTTNSNLTPINATDVDIKIYKTPTRCGISQTISNFRHSNLSASLLISLKTGLEVFSNTVEARPKGK
jgi:hypothetical protein